MADPAARPECKSRTGAKRAADGSAPAAPGELPQSELQVTRTTWPKNAVLHRIHQQQYGAAQFNPGLRGDARFSPIRSAAGEPIPTLYGGSTFDCAAMESVFHDVPFTPGFKAYDKGKLAGQVHSVISSCDDLVLIDLGTKALRKLGVRRTQLIDTESDMYPITRQWAQAIHTQCPDAQGLCWTSRQDDSATAVVLFGDRIAAGVLSLAHSSRNLLDDPTAYSDVLSLAEKIGVDIVPGLS